MSASRDNTDELSGPEFELYKLLVENFNSKTYRSYEAGHNERMSMINRVLGSEGGKETVAKTIELIDRIIAELEKQKPGIEAGHSNRKRKHPVRTLFGDSIYEAQKNKVSSHINGTIQLKGELIAAAALDDVIAQSAFKIRS